MIPKFNHQGLIPPFVSDATSMGAGSRSPYPADLVSFESTLAFTSDRRALFQNFIEYRANLHSLGLIEGIQLVNGSYLEEVERTQDRSPNDIDVVTIFKRPAMEHADWVKLVSDSEGLFDPVEIKSRFSIDGYYVDLDAPGLNIIEQLFYWHGLFEHQRGTLAWKGVVQISLSPMHGDTILMSSEV